MTATLLPQELTDVQDLLHRVGFDAVPINNSHDMRCTIPNKFRIDREVMVMHYVLEKKFRVSAHINGKLKCTMIPVARGAHHVAMTVVRRFMEMT